MQYFDDDGTELNPDLMATPDLCASCTKNGSAEQEVVCNLTRLDQEGEDVFLCFAYQPESPNVDREAVLRSLCERAGVEYSDDLDGGEDPEVIHF
jgi:hypothetical protein